MKKAFQGVNIFAALILFLGVFLVGCEEGQTEDPNLQQIQLISKENRELKTKIVELNKKIAAQQEEIEDYKVKLGKMQRKSEQELEKTLEKMLGGN